MTTQISSATAEQGAAASVPLPRPRDCAVIICTSSHDRWALTTRALRSIEALTEGPRQVVLVVDHNSALEDMARTAFSGVDVVSNHGRQGCSGARNSGIAASRGDVVAFLDDDAVACEGWLTHMCAAYSASDVIGVGGHVAPDWEDGQPAWFPREFLWILGCSYRGLPAARGSVRNPIGANMSFRRSVFAACGDFDENFGPRGLDPTGCDETEFSLRARRTLPGCDIIYEPAARVGHYVPKSRATWTYFVRRCWCEGHAKALVVAAAGRDGTQSERAYVIRTLPSGIATGLMLFVTGRDRHGLPRAGAIVLGVCTAAVAYVRTTVTHRLRGRSRVRRYRGVG